MPPLTFHSITLTNWHYGEHTEGNSGVVILLREAGWRDPSTFQLVHGLV